VTKEEQIALVNTAKSDDLPGALAIAKQIIEATGDLPQGWFYHLATIQSDIPAAMKALTALRPPGAPPYKGEYI
jgi:hypothetical protein